jgi:hypothetical protein
MTDRTERTAAVDAVGTAAARLAAARAAIRAAHGRDPRLIAEEREAAGLLARAREALGDRVRNPRPAAAIDDVLTAIRTLDARVPVAFLPVGSRPASSATSPAPTSAAAGSCWSASTRTRSWPTPTSRSSPPTSWRPGATTGAGRSG